MVAINVFSTSAQSSNRDAVRQDALVIASAAQGYYIRPAPMAGGSNSFTNMTFDDIKFPAEAISDDGMSAYNMNGTYVLNTDAGNSFTITAHPSSDPGYGSKGFDATADDPLTATVTKNDIDW